jgi:hypothetical protein
MEEENVTYLTKTSPFGQSSIRGTPFRGLGPRRNLRGEQRGVRALGQWRLARRR